MEGSSPVVCSLMYDSINSYMTVYAILCRGTSLKRCLFSSTGCILMHGILQVNDGVTEAVEDLLRGKNVVVNFATDHVFWWHT